MAIMGRMGSTAGKGTGQVITMGKRGFVPMVSLRALTEGTVHGNKFLLVPRKCIICDIYFAVKHPMSDNYYREGRISVGVPGNPEYIAKGTELKGGGGVFRAELGVGAGYQEEDAVLFLFWLSKVGNPSSGMVHVVTVFDMS